MSDTMAQRKKEDIERLEKTEQQILEETKNDRCPACGLATSKLAYINPHIVRMFGWVECTRCGCVYCPESTRKIKQSLAATGVLPSGPDGGLIATA